MMQRGMRMAEPVNYGNAYPPVPSHNGNGVNTVVENLNLRNFLIDRGTTGLRRAGGYVREDYDPLLVGQSAVRKFKEMRDSSAVVGSCLYAIEMLIRNVSWHVQPADDSHEARRYAELVDGMLMHDLDQPWGLLLSEILSFLPFGYSWFETILKRRLGPHPPDVAPNQPGLPSQFDDGLIGFGKISQRSQDTVLRFEFDWTGSLKGMHQIDPWAGRQAYLPLEKSLLFRATTWKDNPEGKSILRNAYRSWYLLSHIENVEAVGCERDLAGLPTFYVPPQWFAATATPEEVGQLDMVKRITRNLRNDEQAGLVLPAIFDQENNRLLEFQLASTGGRRAFNTNEIIQRYELRIAQSMLADVIFLGHEAVGSFALASSKTTTLAMALGGFLRVIADEFNRRALPLLWRLNAFPEALRPTLCHGDVETVDLRDLSAFISAYAQAGFDVSDLENDVRRLAGFPERDPEAQAQHEREVAAAVATTQRGRPAANDREAEDGDGDTPA
jgi:hypothetical protein